MFFLLWWFLPKSVDIDDNTQNEGSVLVANDQENPIEREAVSYFGLLSNPLYLFSLIA